MLILKIFRLIFNIFRQTFKSNLTNNIIGLHIFAEQTCYVVEKKLLVPRYFQTIGLGSNKKSYGTPLTSPHPPMQQR